MNKIALVLLLLIPATFARLAILGKIYNLTLAQHFNAPSVTMFQMFALTWFLGAATYHQHDSEDKDVKKLIRKMIGSILTLLFSWGLAALIF